MINGIDQDKHKTEKIKIIVRAAEQFLADESCTVATDYQKPLGRWETGRIKIILQWNARSIT